MENVYINQLFNDDRSSQSPDEHLNCSYVGPSIIEEEVQKKNNGKAIDPVECMPRCPKFFLSAVSPL